MIVDWLLDYGVPRYDHLSSRHLQQLWREFLLSLRSRLDRLPLKPAGRPIHAVQDFADFHRVNSALPRAGEIRDDIPVEAGEAQNLALEEAFLIAVGAESQRTVLDVGCRTNAITLDSFAA